METQVASSLKERVCGCACWASQAFDYDLNKEDKDILLGIASQCSTTRLHFIFTDLVLVPTQSLVGRCGFAQILRAMCEHYRATDEGMRCCSPRTLYDSNRMWKATMMCSPIFSEEAAAKANELTSKGTAVFVVYTENKNGPSNCTLVLRFDEPTMPSGSGMNP